jgi:hypothetical protein
MKLTSYWLDTPYGHRYRPVQGSCDVTVIGGQPDRLFWQRWRL